jgi:hypothetical protein
MVPPRATSPRTTPPPRARQLEPLQERQRRPAPATMSDRPAQRPPNKGLRRFLAFLALAIVFTIAVAVAVVIATNTSNTVVHFRQVVGHDAQSAINSVRDLINQYTK